MIGRVEAASWAPVRSRQIRPKKGLVYFSASSKFGLSPVRYRKNKNIYDLHDKEKWPLVKSYGEVAAFAPYWVMRMSLMLISC